MKKRYIAILIICLIIAILGIVGIIDKGSNIPTEPDVSEEYKEESHQEVATETSIVSYESHIDFENLKKQNSDIYAWLEIPGSDISYPVLQNSEDDSFYLKHNVDKAYDERGALFSESKYNGTDFTDPVTIIYGHRMKSGMMFGNLQQMYTDDFDKYSELVIYTPEEEIRYKVFAAVAFSNRHILYYYDCFNDSRMMGDFVNDLYGVRKIGSRIDKDVKIENTDKLLVLSTCLKGDRTCRFLVIGKRID